MSVRRRPLSDSPSALFVLLLLSLLVSAVLACQKTAVRFSHGAHLKMACGGPGEPDCLTCLSCHGDVASGRTPGHPEGERCSECHDEDSRAVRLPPREKTPAAELAATIHFNHAKHLAMSELSGQCIGCHAGVVSEGGGPHFPDMATCFSCHVHQEQWDLGQCAPCHEQADLSGLFPRTFLRHGPGWDRAHAAAAVNTTVQCAACHTAESCDDCHDVSQGLKIEVRKAAEVNRDFIHPADFLTRHSMEAASEPARCLSCHRTETCDSCHLARGVSAGRTGAVNPHPPGWMGPDPLVPEHHGRAARRDILACASCHDQGPQTNCINCHKVGGPGGNPHPDGWRSQRTPSDLMCNYCHEGP